MCARIAYVVIVRDAKFTAWMRWLPVSQTKTMLEFATQTPYIMWQAHTQSSTRIAAHAARQSSHVIANHDCFIEVEGWVTYHWLVEAGVCVARSDSTDKCDQRPITGPVHTQGVAVCYVDEACMHSVRAHQAVSSAMPKVAQTALAVLHNESCAVHMCNPYLSRGQ